jgi:hypothetical protein
MPDRLRMEAERVRDRVENGDPFWPSQVAVALAIALSVTLPSKLTIGPRWVIPAVEGVLLVVLVVIAPTRATRQEPARRRFALAVIGLVSLTNLVSLGLLVHFLINGGKVAGHTLVLSGFELWGTNVLLFAVWYWELDRGGPVVRFQNPDAMADFQFPQMENPNLEVAPGLPRLPVHIAHQRDGVQPHGHHAAHPHGKGGDGDAVGGGARHRRSGVREGGEHPGLIRPAHRPLIARS